MRNLVTSHRGRLDVASREVPDLPLSTAIFDPVGDTMLCAFAPSADFPQVELQQISKIGEESLFATWPVEIDDPNNLPEIKSLQYFGDNNSAVVVFSNGDIVSITGDDSNGENAVIEIVGTLEDGIQDAAWSPDEEILTAVTPKAVVFLSRVFDPVAEASISTEDLAISKHVSVGWGKKETQFQGKGAKAMRDPTVPEKVDSGIISGADKQEMQLSWRGDGEYVALNCLDETEAVTRRTLRVYSRTGQLNSVSEPVDTMEHQVAWRPSGNVIAAVQRQSGQEGHVGPDLIFFERNGLRRYGFSMRADENQPVKQVAWNVDSDILAIMLGDRIQLWTTKNYHWYLKQEIFSRDGGAADIAPQWMSWHPEKPLTLLISFGGHLEVHQFLWATFDGPQVPPHDMGTSVVVNGTTIKVTPLKIANTPPPMAFREFEIGATPVQVAMSQSNSKFAVLQRNTIDIAEWSPQEKPVKAPQTVRSITLSDICGMALAPKQIAWAGDNVVAVAADVPTGSGLFVIDIDRNSLLQVHSLDTDVYVLKSESDGSKIVFEAVDGSVYRLDDEFELEHVTTLPARSDSLEVWKHVAFGLASSGKLYANHRMLSSGVTSLKLAQSHVMFTTAQHYLKFSHLHENVEDLQVPEDDVVNDERCRSIERGSLLVSVMPSKTALTLQAPRGNLETIHPRILVLGDVRRNIDIKQYAAAFFACRIHRIDLNLLHDYAPAQFFENTELFVQQLDKIEYLDLFLSGLKNEDVSVTMYKQTLKESAEKEDEVVSEDKDMTSKVNKVCDALLKVLLKKKDYLQSALTAFACKSPPDLEAALGFIGKDRVEDPSKAEFSIQHLCFLQDIQLVYNIALSIYDLDLALLVAQQSQWDPKEYLPFLRDLQEASELRRKFKVDDYLNNHCKALVHLSQEVDAFDELCDYMVQHDLYRDAMRIYRYDQEKQRVVLVNYASYLQGKTLYNEAGMLYENLKQYDDALDAYRMGGDWRSALAIVQEPEFDDDKRRDVLEHMAEVTEESKQYHDCALIHLDHLGNIREGLSMLCRGYHFGDALLRAAKEPNRDELLDQVIDPGILEGFAVVSELITDCKSQIKSQVKRLRELREKKQADPLAFFGVPDESDAPDNVSIAPTETSTAPSFLTKYTGKTGETAKTGASRRTQKNKRREERKRARGKKGSAYEEEYLINSVKRLVERLDQTEGDTVRLIEALVKRGYRDHAYQVQRGFIDVQVDLKSVISEVFDQSDEDLKRYDEEGNVYYVEKVEKPEVKDLPKKLSLDY